MTRKLANLLEYLKCNKCNCIFPVTCAPFSVANGMVNYTLRSVVYERYRINTVATFQCAYGYYLSGTNLTTCEPSGSWSEQTPTCEGLYD